MKGRGEKIWVVFGNIHRSDLGDAGANFGRGREGVSRIIHTPSLNIFYYYYHILCNISSNCDYFLILYLLSEDLVYYKEGGGEGKQFDSPEP